MKILFKIPAKVSSSHRLYLDMDLNYLVGDIRKRISQLIESSLSSFHLVTSKFGTTVLLTDSWPLSFFITEENSVIKIKLLETHRCVVRRNSFVSPIISSLSMISVSGSDSPVQLLLTSSKIGNITKLKEIAEHLGTNNEDILNSVEENKWGALHYACLAGYADIVSFLVKKRVNCNKVTIDEWTPLQLCSYFGRTDCLSHLLSHPNLQINKLTKFRGTALHLACSAGHKQIVQMLLDKDPCVTLDDHKKKKPAELTSNKEIQDLLATYAKKKQTRRSNDDDDFPTPFCSEVFIVNSFSLNDRQVFLYMDMEAGYINKYSNKEEFLDKKNPSQTIKTLDIQDVRFDMKRKNHHGFCIETSKLTFKFYTKFQALTEEWVQRIKKATDFIMINKQNAIVEHITEPSEEVNEEDSTDSTNPVITEGENVDIDSFTKIEEIGSGSFGVVYKVKKNNTGQIFAMKTLSKSCLSKQKQLKYAISECKIMKQLNHVFIVPLYYAFQTPKYLYLILELCPNGDLLDLLGKKGVLEENIARFYLAEIILALEYLHESEIIYRDLKPANVLIDADYHAKLADFGLAKELVNVVNPAMTMAGSPAYLPPEIVSKKGATFSSDIYGLGPLLYELLTGKTPFYADDIDLLFQNIKTGKLTFPDHVSSNAKELIGLVMNKDPSKRPQISQIKRHAFFRKMDWEALLAKRIKPPKLGLKDEE